MRVEGQEHKSVGRGGLLLVKLAVVIAAAGLFAYSLSGFIMPNSLPNYENWWLMMVAIGTILAALTFRTDLQTVGIIAATLIIGFSAQLALRTPFWHQHFRFAPSFLSYTMIAFLLIQVVVAAYYLWRQRIFRQLSRAFSEFGWIRSMALIAAMVLASKSSMDFFAQEKIGRYLPHLFVSTAFLATNISVFIALIASIPAQGIQRFPMSDAMENIFSGTDSQTTWSDWVFPAALAAFVLVVCLLISALSFDNVPHLDDIAYYFQARYFSNGDVALPIPASVEAFNFFLMDVYEDKWFSGFFPGWPLALAFGQIIDMPWLINPVLAALNILLLHRFLQAVTDLSTANLVTLLLAVSPWYLSTSSTGLLHTFTYTLLFGTWVLLLKARQRRSLLTPFFAGVLMGWLFLTRPLEGVYMGVLTGLWILTFLRDRWHWRTVALYGFGCLTLALWFFPYNAYLTGDAFVTPLNIYMDKVWGPGANAFGFGPNRGAPGWGTVDALPGHSLFEALINFHQNISEMNSELFGWAGFSLIFAFVFFLWGKWTKFDMGMGLVCGITILLYSLYWYVGGFYTGPRYWFMTLLPFVVFTARGIKVTAERFAFLYPNGLAPHRLFSGIAFLCLCSIVVFESWLAFTKFPDINGYHDDYKEIADQERFRNSLVFISSDNEGEFGSAFWLNEFSQSSDRPLFARDLGAEKNHKLASFYPNREIFFVNGRSSTQSQVTVAQGPLTYYDLDELARIQK